MTSLIEKYLNVAEVKSVKEQKGYDEEAYNLYVQCLNYALEEDEKYGSNDEENYSKKILDYVCEYIDEVEKERKKGYSFRWAKEFARIKLGEPNQNPASMAYDSVYKDDPKQAMLDLELYAAQTNKDADFIRHFKHLIEIDVPNCSPSPEDQAVTYSAMYKDQIQKGKSPVFADKYAFLKAMDEYSEVGCYSEAAEFEKAIESGYSKEYAQVFSMHLSDYIANYYTNYEASIDDELVLLKAKELEKKFEHLK